MLRLRATLIRTAVVIAILTAAVSASSIETRAQGLPYVGIGKSDEAWSSRSRQKSRDQRSEDDQGSRSGSRSRHKQSKSDAYGRSAKSDNATPYKRGRSHKGLPRKQAPASQDKRETTLIDATRTHRSPLKPYDQRATTSPPNPHRAAPRREERLHKNALGHLPAIEKAVRATNGTPATGLRRDLTIEKSLRRGAPPDAGVGTPAGSASSVRTPTPAGLAPVRPPASPSVPAQGPRLASIADSATQLSDEVVVTLSASAPDAAVDAAAQRLNLTVLERANNALLSARLARLLIPDGRPTVQVIQALTAEPGIAAAQPNYVYRRQQSGPNAPVTPQYALTRLSAEAAQRSSTGRDISIAVIDAAIDPDHPDFHRVRIVMRDLTGSGPPSDLSHGTSIAGIIAAMGVTRGIAPDARILGIRTFATFAPPASGRPSRSTSMIILRALDAAMAERARILNLSFAGPHDPLLERALGVAVEERNVIAVAAAGNGGAGAAPAFPAAYASTIAVTATDASDRLYRDANRGGYVAIAAPGVDVLAASAGRGYELVSGTSFAAAHISAIVALLLQVAPDLKASEVRQILEESATDLGEPGKDRAFGAGLANADAALRHRLVASHHR
jgi:hypothetical protein